MHFPETIGRRSRGLVCERGLAAAFFLIALPLSGCRHCLPTESASRLWPRYIEQQADIHYAAPGRPCNPTHVVRCMSPHEHGFHQGFYQAAYPRLHPDDACFVPEPLPIAVHERHLGWRDDEEACRQGYEVGAQAGMMSLLAGVKPGEVR